jgi:hypothetical protein
MARLLTVLLAAPLVCANIAGAQAQSLPQVLPQIAPWNWFAPRPVTREITDGRYWRRYPEGYGAEQGPQVLYLVAKGFLTDPCFNGGCHYYPGDVDYATRWGSLTQPGDSTEAAFRAQSSLAEKAAVSSVMVEPGTPSAHRHARHKHRHDPAAQ